MRILPYHPYKAKNYFCPIMRKLVYVLQIRKSVKTLANILSGERTSENSTFGLCHYLVDAHQIINGQGTAEAKISWEKSFHLKHLKQKPVQSQHFKAARET
jgi:hypothetical protein